MRRDVEFGRAVFLSAIVVISLTIGGIALSGTAAAADTLDDGSLTNPSDPSEVIHAVNSSEKKQINHGYTVNNVTNTGESVKLFLEFPDLVNNSANKLSSFSGNVTCICGGNPESISVSSSPVIVDGPDGDGVKETIEIGIQPNKKDQPIDIIVNFTGYSTWPKETTNVEYGLEGAVDEPNQDVLPPVQFENITVAGGLYVDTNKPNSVDANSAELSGSLWNLNGSSSADLYFTYWEKGKKDSTQTFTNKKTLSQEGSYTDSISGLESDTTYVVKALAEGSNGENYVGHDIRFTTTQLVSTNSPSNVQATSATLEGSLDSLGGASSADVYFIYWEQGNKDSTKTFTAKQTLSSTGSFSESISGLEEDTTYVYQAVAETDSASDLGSETSFTSDNVVKTNAASGVQATSMTLEGTLESLDSQSSADVYFIYWEQGKKSSTKTFTAKQTLSSTGSFSESISGLEEDTTYVYQAAAETGSVNDVGRETEQTTDNVVQTKSATGVQATSMILEGKLSSLDGQSSADVYFIYWEQGKKSSTKTFTIKQRLSSTGSFNQSVSDLEEDTTYVFQAAAELSTTNDLGSETSQTTDNVVATQNASNVDSSSATLEGTLESLDGQSSADVYFIYWEQGNRDSTETFTPKQSMSSTGSFTESISGLDSGTTYVFQAAAETGSVNDAGSEETFTTQ
jgi:surface glycoprotein (TIGR04207 family)